MRREYLLITLVVALVASGCNAPKYVYSMSGIGEQTNVITPDRPDDWKSVEASQIFIARYWDILRRDDQRAVIALLDEREGVAVLISITRPKSRQIHEWFGSTFENTLEAWLYREARNTRHGVSFDYLQDFWTRRSQSDPAATKLKGTASVVWSDMWSDMGLARVSFDLVSTEPVPPYAGEMRRMFHQDSELAEGGSFAESADSPLSIRGVFVWQWVDANNQLLSSK